MIKKILMVIGVLAILGVIVLVGGTYYVGNKMMSEIEKLEPEFRQYVTMTTEEQNAYVSKNIDEISISMGEFFGISGEVSAEVKEIFNEMNNDPEILQAKINWGRSAVAMFIVDNPNITKDLSAEDLQKFQTEKDEYEVRHLEYKKLVNAYKLKKNQQVK